MVIKRFESENAKEVSASITAVPFYLKMGYGFKNGIKEPDGEGLVRMEKIRKNTGEGYEL